MIGLYTRWFHRGALIAGWAAGMVYGTVQAYRTSGGGQAHFGASAAPVFGHTTYIAITALLLNLAVSAVLSVVFKGFGLQDGYDETKPADYVADPVRRPRLRARRAHGRAREAGRLLGCGAGWRWARRMPRRSCVARSRAHPRFGDGPGERPLRATVTQESSGPPQVAAGAPPRLAVTGTASPEFGLRGRPAARTDPAALGGRRSGGG